MLYGFTSLDNTIDIEDRSYSIYHNDNRIKYKKLLKLDYIDI